MQNVSGNVRDEDKRRTQDETDDEDILDDHDLSLSLSVLNSLLDCIMLSTTQNTAESASKDLHPTSICLKKNTL